MNVNDALSGLIDRINKFDAEASHDEVENLIGVVEEVAGVSPKIDLLEQVISFYKNERRAIIEDDIPSVLGEYGLSEATMADGTKVSLDVAYETKQVDKERMVAWLTENGYESIIKDNLSFEKGQVNADLLSFMEERGYSYTRESGVNGMSLKATIKKHIEAGGDYPPPEAISTRVYGYAKVKAPKAGF